MKESTELFHAQWSSLDLESPLFQALTRLSPEAQRAINLRFWENYTIEEISSVLRMSWDQVDQLIEKSLLDLRARLSPLGVPLEILEAC